MSPSKPIHTGARIAHTRKIRHLTQRELASRANVSYSTVTKVEQGILPVSPSVLGALARALSVSVTDLSGQPYIDELRRDQLDALINPIREALDAYDLRQDSGVPPRPESELSAHAEALCAMVRAGNIKKAAAELPGLIYEATAVAHTGSDSRSWARLASTYRAAYDVTTKLGYHDLCTVALDRMEWASERASDPVLGGMRQYFRALAYLRASNYERGRRLIDLGMLRLDQADSGRELDVVRGQLHLGAAVLAGRKKDRESAEGHLQEAERIALRTGPAEKDHWLSFGPTNVGVHRVSVLAELDLYPEAVRSAEEIAIPDRWPPSRLAHHHAEVARAQMWTGHTKAAFKNLQSAREIAPQQTRYHSTVRETYRGLESSKRSMPQAFSAFGTWLGM
ncbi:MULTISPECIES: helix-turn-helix domain-containing protein [Streptomyces]|uniref:XRE family transcriptional regulator n=1 Tax=Streptomyces tsukubensis (strain DSM 42081 / NBRC 108919 / NRRL 18488 / 9993) TaxID=1114943 RepID=I2MYU1_STRT9|nr:MULTISPECIES: helix-turn-helix transcriptional regulator [Streptomyces]AZK94233.1 transcriptional regulator [Streptomyces tsukubensis]EIF89938.1 helix-turn-helix domain-containing protein [Streptomyces tsukubensis NRRL18488]MYS68017.1 helix-turn-helix domain-containing protein [Streptomyces sp. SID5473]QKM69667.1 XRE family transcriptional regulator [Streptomyces tsukubensis NRRL18488]TAI46368.1 XRE family transcriptional regulator [Streptomyces tsukubensis]